MGMYDKLARQYDFGEKWIGQLKYGNLIANETADYIDSQYKKAHFLKNILTTQFLIYEKLKNAIPNSVHEKNLEFVWDKKFYAITFRK